MEQESFSGQYHDRIIEPLRKLKILMLHGLCESGAKLKEKTRFFEHLLKNAFPEFPEPGFHRSFPGGIDLFYPTAPNRTLRATLSEVATRDDVAQDSHNIDEESGHDNWTWGAGDFKTDIIPEYKLSLRYILEVMKRDGPFDGIFGVSVGAAMAATLVSLAERCPSSKLLESLGVREDELPPRFQFAILCSGFMMHHLHYRSLYYPKLHTPVLNFFGYFDPVVDQESSMKLIKRFENSTTMSFPSGHSIPRCMVAKSAMLEFIRAHLTSDLAFWDIGHGIDASKTSISHSMVPEIPTEDLASVWGEGEFRALVKALEIVKKDAALGAAQDGEESSALKDMLSELKLMGAIKVSDKAQNVVQSCWLNVTEIVRPHIET